MAPGKDAQACHTWSLARHKGAFLGNAVGRLQSCAQHLGPQAAPRPPSVQTQPHGTLGVQHRTEHPPWGWGRGLLSPSSLLQGIIPQLHIPPDVTESPRWLWGDPLSIAPCRQGWSSEGAPAGPCRAWKGWEGTLTLVPGGTQSHPAGGVHPQVSTAEVSDAASYMCVAQNPAGSAEKLFTLRVQGELG